MQSYSYSGKESVNLSLHNGNRLPIILHLFCVVMLRTVKAFCKKECAIKQVKASLKVCQCKSGAKDLLTI